jgi:hypothetical protein
MSNPFEKLAEKQMVAATKAKHRAAEKRAAVKIIKSERDAPMKLSEMEQERADQAAQLRSYRAAKRAELQALLDGRHGMEWRQLIHELAGLTINDASSLPDYIADQKWLLEADHHARRTALYIIAGRLAGLRLENGYAPFDDSLPGEEPTAFEIVRKQLRTET